MSAPVAESLVAESNAASAKKSGKVVLMVGLVTLVIVVQVVATWFLMPKSMEVKDDHKSAKGGTAHGAAAAAEEPMDVPENDTAEVKMGEFTCTNSTASPGIIVNVSFTLTAVTTPAQASSLEAQLKAHEARVRQVVNKIVRSSSQEDLNDPNLGTIKRLVREEVNRLLRKSFLQEVVISDIRTLEQ